MEKLINIQQKLKAPKGQYNTFGKYNYRSAEDILEAVKPLLDGALLTLQDEVVVVGEETIKDTKILRTYIRATVTFTDGDFTISTTAYAREPQTKTGMDASQITGTASSYARKYALNGLFCIDDNKDADTDEYVKQTEEKKDVGYFSKKIDECKTVNEVNKLYYEWSKLFEFNSGAYKEINRISNAKKIKLQ